MKMMDGRLGRDVLGVRGCWFRVLTLVLALVGLSATAGAVRITRPVRARRVESAAAPDFSHTSRRSHKADKRETASARRGSARESVREVETRSAAMTHAQAERRLAELRSEAARRSSRKARVARDRAELRPVAKTVMKHGAGAAPARVVAKKSVVAAKRGISTGVAHPPAWDAGVDAGEASQAQRHDVAASLAKAQASADVDGGVAAESEDAVNAPAVVHAPMKAAAAARVSAPVASVSADGYAEPDVVKEATAAEAARQKAAIVELAGGDVDGAEMARKNAAMKELLRPSHAEMAEEAMAPRIPGLYGRDGRVIMPAPLRGSREILIHQNEMADEAGLNRIRTSAQLESMVAHHLLVSFPETAGLRVNPELPAERRTARPWTVKFAEDTSRAFYKEFHEPLELSSAVRTIAYQKRLQRVNGNAAAISGEAASPHLTGQALDFGKHGMSTEEIAWMRTYLLPLMEAGKVDVEEEFQQACFHISVYRSYVHKGDAGEVAELK